MPGARLRVPFAELGVPPEAASSVLFPAVMGWQQAARVLLTSDWVSAPELVELGLALKVCAEGTVLDETVALAARIAAHPRAATRASTSLVRAARRDAVVEANRREQARLRHAARRRGRQRHPGRVRRPARRRVLTVRLGITAALTDLDLAPAVLAAAVEELGFDSLYLPEHTHLPVEEDTPPALVGGVRLDDYKRCLDPLVALSTAAAVTTRIGLGTGILLAAQHEPILLAKQVATLDHLSGGRVTLGVGYRLEPDRGRGPRRRLGPSARRRARAPGGHGGHLVDRPGRVPRRVRRTSGRPGPGPSRSSSHGCARSSAAAPTTRCSAAVVESADGWIPIGGSGLAAAIPRLHALAERGRARPGRARRSSPSAPSPIEGKLEHYAGLGHHRGGAPGPGR